MNDRILLLSGPNLGLLGTRQPEVYGTSTLAEHVAAASEEAGRFGLVVDHVASDHEGDLVTAVGRARVGGAGEHASAVIVNAGALTHYAWSLSDALAAFDGPVVELHLSNPHRRESWRRLSVVAPVASGTIAGFGGAGYRLAVRAAAGLLGCSEG
ncbi:MAG: 3-dehydroquinate dehydratase [Actinomycetota bacterium]|nr:3-dehydroquinate dehydratase [Actinomycetota bacterium]